MAGTRINRKLDLKDLEGVFSGPVRRVRVSPLYHLGLLMTAGMLLLVPVVYAGMIAAAGYGVYYHATEHVGLVTQMDARPRTVLLMIAAYLVPLAVGAAVVVFMLKPFLAKPAHHEPPEPLSRFDEPVLYHYVEMLCAALGAPVPDEIFIDCDVNAAAGLKRVFGRRVELVLGAPLIIGLDLRQFTGVLAHELGHLSQRFGMRVTALVERLGRWVARIAWERDAWDTALDDALGRGLPLPIAIAIMLIKLCVWVARLLLKILAMIIGVMTSFMARRMEFDADMYSVVLCGAESFEPESHAILELVAASDAAFSQIPTGYAERRLPDDLPLLIARNLERFKPEERKEIREKMLGESGGLFATHPRWSARIAASKKHDDPGVIAIEARATALFHDLKSVCKKATYVQYRRALGRRLADVTFVPTEHVLEHQRAADRGVEAIKRMIPGEIVETRAVFPDLYRIEPPKDPRAAGQRIRNDRQWLREGVPAAKANAKNWSAQAELICKLQAAKWLIEGGVKSFDPRAFGIPAVKLSVVREAEADARRAMGTASANLEAYEQRAVRRIETLLSLLAVPGIEKKLPDAPKLRARVDKLLHPLMTLRHAHGNLMDMTFNMNGLEALLHVYTRGLAHDEGYVHTVFKSARELNGQVRLLRNACSSEAYPYGHTQKNATIGTYLIEVPAPDEDPEGVVASCDSIIGNYRVLYWRLFGEIAAIAEHVEKAVGLAPKPKPKKPAPQPPEPTVVS